MPAIVQTAFNHLPVYWKLATFKCAIYASIVGWGVFKAGVNGFDDLSVMTHLQKIELAGDVVMAMAAVWMAFIDQTISKVQESQNVKSIDLHTDKHTEFVPPAVAEVKPVLPNLK